jgi:hypothetical protein
MGWSKPTTTPQIHANIGIPCLKLFGGASKPHYQIRMCCWEYTNFGMRVDTIWLWFLWIDAYRRVHPNIIRKLPRRAPTSLVVGHLRARMRIVSGMSPFVGCPCHGLLRISCDSYCLLITNAYTRKKNPVSIRNLTPTPSTKRPNLTTRAQSTRVVSPHGLMRGTRVYS